ncbi:GT2D2 protein, partial [Polyodon spathula]|nr:GT2D2 protein [Polyodon spathula]
KSKKRKIDKEGRLFQERWEFEYLFVEQQENPICLLCKGSTAVMKLFNLRRHESDAAVKASYLVSELIAKLSDHFSEGAFVKDCMLKVTEKACFRQLTEKASDFVAFTLVGESTLQWEKLVGLTITDGAPPRLHVSCQCLAVRTSVNSYFHR